MINTVVNLFIAIMGPIYAALATQALPLTFASIGTVILLAAGLLRLPKQERISGA